MHRKTQQRALSKPAMQSCAGARLYLSILSVSGLLALSLSMPDKGLSTESHYVPYALRRCRTDLLVIFDAEDRPHPQQLREAAARFYRADKALACLQAPLHIQPMQGRWLQLQFALEYRLLFGFILPGLSGACASLPLGGSSNYFRTDRLLTLGGWDDHNLTEDADLGLRLAQSGHRTEMLTLPTIENAPHELVIWMPQRTRWLSGHMQTVHVHALPRMNLRSLPGWAVCMCVLLARLISGPIHALMLVSVLRFAAAPAPRFEIDLFMGLAGAVYLGLMGLLIVYSPARTWWGRIGLALSHPLYWLLTLPALLFAIKRMAFNQMGWLKSTHVPYDTKRRGWSG